MLENLKNLNKLRKQAHKLKEAMAKEIMIGTALGGKIQITMDGNQEVREVRIESDLLEGKNKAEIEAGVKEAITQSLTQIQMMMARKMQDGGLF